MHTQTVNVILLLNDKKLSQKCKSAGRPFYLPSAQTLNARLIAQTVLHSSLITPCGSLDGIEIVNYAFFNVISFSLFVYT